MSVNPIDLQVSFSQLNNVGKQQSNVKESDEVKQGLANQILHKESEKESEEIPETKDMKEGPGRIKDKQEKNDKNKKEESKENKKENAVDKEKKASEKDNLKDPETGQKIDILG